MTHARQCTACGAGMNEGYVIEGANEHYCSDPCLHKNVTPEEFLELYGEGDTQTYYTEWDDEAEWDDEEELAA